VASNGVCWLGLWEARILLEVEGLGFGHLSQVIGQGKRDCYEDQYFPPQPHAQLLYMVRPNQVQQCHLYREKTVVPGCQFVIVARNVQEVPSSYVRQVLWRSP
jgi:hypothetical protein